MSRKNKRADRAAEWERLHQEAMASDKEFYRDPTSGDLVSTRRRLERLGKCCKSGCRHCPYGFRRRK